MFQIWGAIQRSKDAEVNALNRNVCASDLQLVRESLRIQWVLHIILPLWYVTLLLKRQQAASDKTWGEIMLNEDFVFSVHGLSETLGEAWLKIKSDLFGSDGPYLDTYRLLAMQRILHVSPLICEENLVARAEEQRELEEQWKEVSRTKKETLKRQNLRDKRYKSVRIRYAIAFLIRFMIIIPHILAASASQQGTLAI